jgi:hypothetical protein
VIHFEAQIKTLSDARVFMRTTVALDDDLVRLAQEYTGVAEKTADRSSMPMPRNINNQSTIISGR